MPFLEASGLVKSYPVGGRALTVLRDLDLQVEAGEMLAIVGASGVGKSTLLHVLGGLDRVDQGHIAINGTELTAMPDAEIVAFRNRHVGFVFQFHHLLPEFNAVENAEMPMRIARMAIAEARPRAEELLTRVGLGERLTHRPGTLSGGEQQRVAVARALVMRPSLLLADEPTGDLDEHTADALHGLLREMHQIYGLTSVIATHNPRLAAACDRTLRLESGRLIAPSAGKNLFGEIRSLEQPHRPINKAAGIEAVFGVESSRTRRGTACAGDQLDEARESGVEDTSPICSRQAAGYFSRDRASNVMGREP
jgi:lipoprotein-releasing system ATP-binding protein